MPLPNNALNYLVERMRRGDTVLFCGAGFSRGAYNLVGKPMPLASELPPLIWKLCYPGAEYDGSRLDDLFQVATNKAPRQLQELLQQQLGVDPTSIPEFYGELLALPWFRVYTLNVDDLIPVVARRGTLPRQPVQRSALSWAKSAEEPERGTLPVIHLNGVLEDGPSGVTFSPTQYAERLAGQEPLYAQCAVDVLSRPVVYIGTPLDETPLWQHVSMRRRGPRTRREFRRQSFIVTPSLDRARRELLEREFHVTHLPMTVEEFATELVVGCAPVKQEGLSALLAVSSRQLPARELPLVQDLAANSPAGSSDFLLGRSPRWGDVRDGVSAPRDADDELLQKLQQLLLDTCDGSQTLLLSGTAGCGKTTIAMRVALALSASGVPVAWSDASVEISPFDIRRSMEADHAPPMLVIDEADRYGAELVPMVADLRRSRPRLIVLFTLRSGRGIDRVLDRADALQLPVEEVHLPHLSNRDIGALLDVLDTHNRLGVLKNVPRDTQISRIRDRDGRQLIVALLEATSGRRFSEMLEAEMNELESEQRQIYALVAVASALRFGLTRDELLLAVDDTNNATLAAIDLLLRRHLLLSDSDGCLYVRHRVIADTLLRVVASEGLLADILIGLAVAAASKVSQATRKSHRHYRRIRSLIGHNLITRELSVSDGRRLYEELEAFLNWDHHYWLQRGTFELEHGDLQLAENFLNQSFQIEPEDASVQTEVGYLRLKLAIVESAGAESRRLRDEGFDLLDRAIASRRASDPHQFHIYGQQAIAWLRRGDVRAGERVQLLNRANERVEEGRRQHPRNEPLRETYVELQNERLGIASE